jgi:hypothetical protein
MCLSHLIYTVRPCLIHTCHAGPMPCSDHAVLLKATAQHGRRETACGLPARVRLLPATTRSSTKIVIRSIPILLTTTVKSGSNTLRINCWTSNFYFCTMHVVTFTLLKTNSCTYFNTFIFTLKHQKIVKNIL